MPKYFVDITVKVSIPVEAGSEALAKAFIENDVATSGIEFNQTVMPMLRMQLIGEDPSVITVTGIRPADSETECFCPSD